MTMSEPIPTALYIKQTKSYIYVNYDNQLQTCNRCGFRGHRVRQCITPFEEWEM